jgi:anti-sigma factor RsiW
MNCSQYDVKAYLLDELAETQRGPLEEHLRGCPDCREELERLRLTESALRALPDQEMPRQIAFVSDKVFEPSGWARLWNSAPRLGFASAAVLALAILVHGFVRPVPVAAPVAVDTQAMEARIEREVAARLETAVAQASAQQSRQAAQMVAAVEHKLDQQRQSDLLAVDETFRVLQKKMNVQYRASLDSGGKP